MKTGAIILSRFSSSRLPGKALIDINGKPLLQHVIDLCRKVSQFDEIILSTSNETDDDCLEKYAKSAGIKVFRGSLNNVASRFSDTIKEFELDIAVRVNGDSPINSCQLFEKGIEALKEDSQLDLVTNIHPRTYPYGVSLEVIRAKPYVSLVENESLSDDEKEHVTKFIYDHDSNFKILNIKADSDQLAGARLAVDTKEDLEMVRELLKTIEAKDIEISDLEKVVTELLEIRKND